MKRAEAGHLRERFYGQVFAEMRLDVIDDAPEPPGIERAADARQRNRARIQVRMAAQDLNSERERQGLRQHLAAGCRIDHLGPDRPRDMLDQRIAEAAVVVQADGAGIEVEFPEGGFGQRRRRQVHMYGFGNIAVDMDHVLANAGRAQPDRAGDRIVMLQPPVAAPADMDAALQHDDDFGFARPDLAEIAFGMAPAFGEQAGPSPVPAAAEQRPGGVFCPAVSGQSGHGAPFRSGSTR